MSDGETRMDDAQIERLLVTAFAQLGRALENIRTTQRHALVNEWIDDVGTLCLQAELLLNNRAAWKWAELTGERRHQLALELGQVAVTLLRAVEFISGGRE